MFDHTHYVPILKGKRGEYTALEALFPGDRAALTPVIEVPPVDWNWDDDIPRKTEVAHLQSTCDSLERYLGTSRPVFIDLGLSELNDVVEGDVAGRHPFACLFDLGRAKGLNILPVVPLDADAPTVAAVAGIAAQDGCGAMIRVPKALVFDRGVTARLTAMASTLGLPVSQLDLLLDLEAVSPGDVPAYGMSLPLAFGYLPTLSSWRTFTLAGCAFPPNLSSFVSGSVGLAPRVEWQLWKAVRAALPVNARCPTFSDYAVSFTELPDGDPRVLATTQNIRYTGDDEWLIFKGLNFKKKGGANFVRLCQQLMGRPEFMGPGFSEGDRYIVGCATGSETPGNPETWRRVGTNHHLTFVVRQLASAPAASALAGPAPVTGRGGDTR